MNRINELAVQCMPLKVRNESRKESKTKEVTIYYQTQTVLPTINIDEACHYVAVPRHVGI